MTDKEADFTTGEIREAALTQSEWETVPNSNKPCSSRLTHNLTCLCRPLRPLKALTLNDFTVCLPTVKLLVATAMHHQS